MQIISIMFEIESWSLKLGLFFSILLFLFVLLFTEAITKLAVLPDNPFLLNKKKTFFFRFEKG